MLIKRASGESNNTSFDRFDNIVLMATNIRLFKAYANYQRKEHIIHINVNIINYLLYRVLYYTYLV